MDNGAFRNDSVACECLVMMNGMRMLCIIHYYMVYSNE